MTNQNKMLVAILGAAAAGAALALLFAPEKGAKLRKRIARRGRDLEDYLDEVVAKGKKAWIESKGDVRDNFENFEEYFDHIMAEGKKSWKEMKADLQEGAEKAKDRGEGYVGRLMREGKRAWNTLTHEAEETVGSVREKVDELRQTARKSPNDGHTTS